MMSLSELRRLNNIFSEMIDGVNGILSKHKVGEYIKKADSQGGSVLYQVEAVTLGSYSINLFGILSISTPPSFVLKPLAYQMEEYDYSFSWNSAKERPSEEVIRIREPHKEKNTSIWVGPSIFPFSKYAGYYGNPDYFELHDPYTVVSNTELMRILNSALRQKENNERILRENAQKVARLKEENDRISKSTITDLLNRL